MGGKGANSRRMERIRAFQVLYGLYFMPAPAHADLQRLFREMPLPPAAETGQQPDEAKELEGFAWELAEGVWRHAADLDELIAGFSRNWRLERMGRIELTLLRLAMFELAFRPDVPPKVVINEALDLTARFGDAKAKGFINGILDAAARATDAGTLARPEDCPQGFPI